MDTRKRIIAGGISLLIYAVIFVLSSLPTSSLPSGIPDVVPHFLEYFLLAFFFIQVFAGPRRVGALTAAALMLAVLGFLDEWHQRSVPGRFFSWLDVLYDGIGALIGLAAYLLLSRRRNGMR